MRWTTGGLGPECSARTRSPISASAWVEYVRQNQRVTQADAEIGERVRALHSGPNPPVVHRMIERQTGSLPYSTTTRPPTLGDALSEPSRPA